jgi:hypothetical protein
MKFDGFRYEDMIYTILEHIFLLKLDFLLKINIKLVTKSLLKPQMQAA